MKREDAVLRHHDVEVLADQFLRLDRRPQIHGRFRLAVEFEVDSDGVVRGVERFSVLRGDGHPVGVGQRVTIDLQRQLHVRMVTADRCSLDRLQRDDHRHLRLVGDRVEGRRGGLLPLQNKLGAVFPPTGMM